MDALSPLRRSYFYLLSRLHALQHAISSKSLLGIRIRSLVLWIPILILLYGWLRNWSVTLLAGLLIAIIVINYSLWRAKRKNFNRFVPSGATFPHEGSGEPLPPNRKVGVLATGLFSVTGRESNLLLRPAEYWYVPLGEHVVMVEQAPGKYLYQFFNGQSLQEVRPGWLLYGSHPHETLAVTFLARWGPEYTRYGPEGDVANDGDSPPARRMTVYLSIPNDAIMRSVWMTIVNDARRVRADAGQM